MKKKFLMISMMGVFCFSACSNEKSNSNTESGTSDTATQNDSATTNPINSEYGTPNASENIVDSTQNANKSGSNE